MAQGTFRAKLTGGKELKAALEELPKRIGKAALRRALLKAAAPIAAEAQALAPVRTGRLKRGIVVSTRLSRRQRRPKAGEAEVFVGAGPSRHAHLVEFGTAERRHESGKSVGRMPARPFLRPAWEGGKMKALDDFGRLLWVEIEKAAKRLAKRQARK